VQDGVFVSGGGTDPPSLFLPDDIFDIVVAGFCLNNIIRKQAFPVDTPSKLSIYT
jgi:hypothetical protein